MAALAVNHNSAVFGKIAQNVWFDFVFFLL